MNRGAERKTHKAPGTRAKHKKGVYVPHYTVKIQAYHPCAPRRWGVYDGHVLIESGFFKDTAIAKAKELNEEYEEMLEVFSGTLNK